MEVQIISKYHGDAEWVRRGEHFYTAWRHRSTTVGYRCGASGCLVRWNNKAGVPGPVIGEHNHEPEIWVPERNEMFCRLKSRCMAEATNLQNIYEEEVVRYPVGAPHLAYSTVLPSMRKWRRATQPPVPSTLAEYGSAISQHAVFGAIYLGTVSAGGAHAVLLGMEGYAECLRDSTVLVVDGTFQTVPAGLRAYQILTLHCVVLGQHYHPIVALMENRRQALYIAVLERIWELAGNPQPESVVTDYEPALQSALRAVAQAPVQGCYFHFLQALVKRARQEHLPMGHTSQGGRLVRLYATLALLPPGQVEAAFAELPAAARFLGISLSQTFHDYFREYWMARIRPESFSVYQRTHRTSNTAESFHAYLKNMLGASPNIWRFTRMKTLLPTL